MKAQRTTCMQHIRAERPADTERPYHDRSLTSYNELITAAFHKASTSTSMQKLTSAMDSVSVDEASMGRQWISAILLMAWTVTLISFVAIDRWYTFGAVDRHCAQGLVPLRYGPSCAYVGKTV